MNRTHSCSMMNWIWVSSMMNRESFHRRAVDKKRERERFMATRPPGMKWCFGCQREFGHDGYPSPESWTCSKECFEAQERYNPILYEDTITTFSNIVDLDKVVESLKDIRFGDVIAHEENIEFVTVNWIAILDVHYNHRG